MQEYKSKRELSAKDSTIAFIGGFLLTQLAVIIFAFLATSICHIFGVPTDITLDYLNNNAYGYLILTLCLDLVLMGIFVFYKRRTNLNVFAKPKVKTSALSVALAIISLFALIPIVYSFNNLLATWGVTLTDIPYTLTTENYLVSIISLAILPAIAEELLFRGVIFSGFKKHGAIISIILTSVMFSLFHMSATQIIYPLLFGLILGVIMYKTNNILYCIAMHAVNNFISLTISYAKLNLYSSHWLYLLMALILAAIWLTIIMVYIFKNKTKNTCEKMIKSDKKILFGGMLIMFSVWILMIIIG